MSTQNFTADKWVNTTPEVVRNDLKGMFDSKPVNDPSYIMYHMIDQNIPKDGSTKDDILRIVQFFNTLSFFESVNDVLRDAYLEHNNLRFGFLTDGALFYVSKNGGQTEINETYNINELCELPVAEYSRILGEIETQLEAIDSLKNTNTSETKWYFWPGCEMKIPESTTILVDTSVAKSKFVITKKPKNSDNKATQIVLEEKPYQLEVSLLGDNELLYNETNNPKATELKLKPGFFAINKSEPEFEGLLAADFSEIELTLNNGDHYDYTLYVPYDSPRFDIKTHIKIYGNDEKVEEFIATCT